MFGVNNMIHFIQNIGEYFASNYFDEDFSKKVIEKSGYSNEAIREFNQQVNRLKPDYFKLNKLLSKTTCARKTRSICRIAFTPGCSMCWVMMQNRRTTMICFH